MCKFLILILTFFFFLSCIFKPSNSLKEGLKDESLPRLESLWWSPITSTIILLSSKDVKLEEYALRQGDKKQIESLKNIFLRTNEPTTIRVSKGFLNKKENELVLVKLLEVERKKGF